MSFHEIDISQVVDLVWLVVMLTSVLFCSVLFCFRRPEQVSRRGAQVCDMFFVTGDVVRLVRLSYSIS